MTQSHYGQKVVKPAGSAQSIKTEPAESSGRNQITSPQAQTSTSPRSYNFNQNNQNRVQPSANTRPNQSKVEESPKINNAKQETAY